MKGIFVLLVCMAAAACRRDGAAGTGAPAAPAEAEGDTADAAADTVEAEQPESPPPAAVDALFADFIYVFSSDRAFQRRRTAFPLRRFRDGGEMPPLEKEEWKFDRLYNKAELHIIVFGDEGEMEGFDTSAADSVLLEFLEFGKDSVARYVFEKLSGRWMLTQLNSFGMRLHEDAEFLEFYGRFAADSAYQRSHLNEYVNFNTYGDGSGGDEIEGVIDIEQWYVFHPDLPSGSVLCLNYGQKTGGSSTRVVSVRGNSNSWSSVFKFRKKNGVWKLVKFAY